MSGIYADTMDVMRLIKRGTVDDVMPYLQGKGYTRDQVFRAMRRATEKDRKQLICEGHVRKPGHKGGTFPSVYRLSTLGALNKRVDEPLMVSMPLSSVWGLAQPAPMVNSWPPLWQGGRAFSPLGGWHEQEAA